MRVDDVISLSMLKDMFFIMYIVWEDEYKG